MEEELSQKDDPTITFPLGAVEESNFQRESSDYATLPYSTGFENGLDQYWETNSSSSFGRIQTTSLHSPHSGTQHLAMDVTTNSNYNTNQAFLYLDLSGGGDIQLSFWWAEHSDESHSSDGVYFSDDDGITFTKVHNLINGSPTGEDILLDVDELLQFYNLNFNSTFVVKFQQYDNYSLTVDGFTFDDVRVEMEFEKKLVPDIAEGWDMFGSSVSISGEYAIVGAQAYFANNHGAVFVFKRVGAGWKQEARLSTSNAYRSSFGHSASISGDYAIVGALWKYYNDYGGASIFKRIGSSWEEEELIATDLAERDLFGKSVSIDGDYAIVGAPGYYGPGAAYFFKRVGSSWVQENRVVSDDGEKGDYFGWSVSISGDFAIIGAKGVNGSSGAAYIFKRNEKGWEQVSKLLPTDGEAYDFFGTSVSISDNWAIIGSMFDDDNGDNSGSAYVFERNGKNWVQNSKLKASDGSFWANFGHAVSISGESIIVGADEDYDFGKAAGSAYLFKLIGGSWVQEKKLKSGDIASFDIFGTSVAIERNSIIVGASGDDVYASGSGSAYIFEENMAKDIGYEGVWSVSGGRSASNPANPRYLFTVTEADNLPVTIDLISSTDTYLYLVNGETGAVLHYNDDGGDGLNSRLSEISLNPGTYIAVAATYSTGRSGSFELTIDGAGGGVGPAIFSPVWHTSSQTRTEHHFRLLDYQAVGASDSEKMSDSVLQTKAGVEVSKESGLVALPPGDYKLVTTRTSIVANESINLDMSTRSYRIERPPIVGGERIESGIFDGKLEMSSAVYGAPFLNTETKTNTYEGSSLAVGGVTIPYQATGTIGGISVSLNPPHAYNTIHVRFMDSAFNTLKFASWGNLGDKAILTQTNETSLPAGTYYIHVIGADSFMAPNGNFNITVGSF